MLTDWDVNCCCCCLEGDGMNPERSGERGAYVSSIIFL